MSTLSIGLSALSVNQRLLDLTGQNIANANTAGYHRQVAALAARTHSALVGSGVEITRINRIVNSLVEKTLLSGRSASENVSAQLQAMSQIQTLLAPPQGSLNDLVQNFFNQAERLSSQPSDLTQRRTFLAAASSLTEGINRFALEMNSINESLEAQVTQAVATANNLIPQIGELNGQIQRLTLQGTQPNDLKDQRDILISQLATIMNTQTIEGDFGQVSVIAGGIPVVLGNQPSRLEMFSDPQSGLPTVRIEGSATNLSITDGQLAGLLNVHNQIIPELKQQLDALTQELISGVDQIHATSLPLGGPLASLSGLRDVKSATVPLSQAGLVFPPQAGTLSVGVTDKATGTRVLRAINHDPATQSLQDVATALSAVPNIQAVVDPQTLTLRILAKPGHGLDFTGQLPTMPDSSTLTGTTTAQIAGKYSGAINDRYTFRVMGSGPVGVSANLSLEVTNSSGNVLGTLNVGQGYSPDSVLQTVDGVAVKLSSGTLNAGETFSTSVVANADSGGLLAALGLGSFFQGNGVGNLQVRSDLLANPQNLALSQTGQPADGGALTRLADLRRAAVMANGQQSFEQYLTSMIGSTGARIQDLTQQKEAQDIVTERLQAEQLSISGVDTNEELVKMMQFQRAFQAAARFIAVVDQVLGDLVDII